MKRLVLFTLLAAVAGVLVVFSYIFFTDRGRATTAPIFTELAAQVIGSTLISPANPSAEISFSPEFSYLGGQKFILYGTADVEQHFFIAEKQNGDLKSVFWLQFEGVRPGIEWQYDYSNSPLRLEINGFDFYTDTAAGVSHPIFKYGKPGTDGYLARKYLAKKGYNIPTDYAYARLVHLPTEDRRKELLIIFMDDLTPTGLSGRDLQSGGVHEAQWPALSQAHLEKIQQIMSLERTN